MVRMHGTRLVIVSDPIEKRGGLALKKGADVALNPMRRTSG
jgi:threonine dehydrogenase-like Zn-dependent dehydrogenase